MIAASSSISGMHLIQTYGLIRKKVEYVNQFLLNKVIRGSARMQNGNVTDCHSAELPTMSATFAVSRECAAAKLSVLSAHLADSIARLLTLPYIYLDFVKMISTIKK